MLLKTRSDSGENEILPCKNKIVKKKINNDDFTIPKFNEYEWLETYNYTLNQLRSITRHYKLTISGNKTKLKNRIFTFLEKSLYCTKIQRIYKGYLQRCYNKSHGPGFPVRNICNNATDFYTMDDISSIPLLQFFSYRDIDGFVYGFDILSLYNLILNNGVDVKNPYNRNELPTDIINKIRYKIRLSRVLKIPIKINIETNNAITGQKRLELRVLSLFQEIDSLGNYSNPSWFTSLDRSNTIKYLRELLDIWCFRAELSNEVKRMICPPSGDPTQNTNVNLIYNMSNASLQRFVLSVMENLVKNGINRESKSLGAYYVLAGLTLVNSEAAEAIPWLYHSVVHI